MSVLPKEAQEKIDGAVTLLEDLARELRAGTITQEKHDALVARVDALAADVSKQSIRLHGADDELKAKGKRFNLGRVIKARCASRVPDSGVRFDEDWFRKHDLADEFDIMVAAGKANAGKSGERAVMTTANDASLGWLVPMEIASGIVEKYEASSVLSALGMRSIGATGDPYVLLKKSAGGTASYVGEGAPGTTSDLTLATAEARKKELVGVMIMTLRQLDFSDPRADVLVEEDLSLRISLLKDLKGVMGTGTTHEPLGVWNLPSVQTQAVAANNLTFLDHHEAYGKLVTANADTSALGFLTHWNALKFWLREKNDGSTGAYSTSYYNLPLTIEALRQNLGGLTQNIQHSTQLPTNLGAGTNEAPAILGDWKQMIDVQWGGAVLETSREATVGGQNLWANRMIAFQAVMFHDYLFRHEEGFVKLTGAKTV